MANGNVEREIITSELGGRRGAVRVQVKCVRAVGWTEWFHIILASQY